ncbi:MAG: hypothetical protein ACK45H_12670, partial [Bacteroidota bacterium]
MNKTELIVNNGLVRIVGVFETSNKPKQTASRFMQSGFEVENIKDPFALNFHKNYWYPDFRDIYFLKKEDTSATIYTKDIDEKVDFVVRTNRETGVQTLLNVCINSAEIFMFKGHLNFFSIDLSIEEKNLSSYSDLTFIVRNFESAIKSEGTDLKWVNWIEKNILCGIKISSDPSVKKVKVDDYSGSKFKLFSVLDLADAIDSSVRSELLYDIGCSAPIGSAGGNTAFTPSEPYFEELMENKISVFN